MHLINKIISLLGLLSAVAWADKPDPAVYNAPDYPITFFRTSTDTRAQRSVWKECYDIPEPEIYGRDMCWFYVGTQDKATAKYTVWDKAECSFYNGPGCTLEKDHEGNVPKGPHVNKKGMELFDNALTLRSYICEPKQ